jgi:uncharacterized RDD family membrane protein YckC
MEQQNINETASDKNILFNVDGLDLESMDFKPMTEGLGFHHEEKKTKIVKPSVAFKNTTEISSPKTRHSVNGVTSNLGISNANNQREISAHKSELAAFYGEETKVNQKVQKETKIEARTLVKEEAGKLQQFGAWVVDLLLISSIVAMTAALLAAVSGIDIRTLARLVTTNDLIFFTASLFCLFYMLYFTVLDLASTPGKSIFKLQLVKTNNKEVRVTQTFFRSIITLLSFLTIGLPSLIDFQGKLSDTKVVK